MLTSHILIVLSLDPDRRKGPGFPLFLIWKIEGRVEMRNIIQLMCCSTVAMIYWKPTYLGSSTCVTYLRAGGLQDGGVGALGSPGDALHNMFVLPQLGFALLGGHHPHTHRLVIGATGDQRAVLVGTDHPHPLPVACECLHTVPAEGRVQCWKCRQQIMEMK